jgi:protein TonB
MTTMLARCLRAAAVAAIVLAVPGLAHAQDKVFDLSELETPPRLQSPSQAVRQIQRSYPDVLRRKGIGGDVQVQFVVGPDGSVDPSSVEVLDASAPELGDAAISVVKELKFTPAKVGSAPVRARVVLPISYKP